MPTSISITMVRHHVSIAISSLDAQKVNWAQLTMNGDRVSRTGEGFAVTGGNVLLEARKSVNTVRH